jgi:hypothetical protein
MMSAAASELPGLSVTSAQLHLHRLLIAIIQWDREVLVHKRIASQVIEGWHSSLWWK